MSLIPSPLADRHARLGARTAAFAGWEMPISYAGTVAEHTAVRDAVGVFDVSHLGTVWVTGAESAAVVDASFTNDPSRLADGESQYTLCATPEGGVVDDLIVYRLGGERWLVVPNAANTTAVVARLVEQAEGRQAVVRDASREWAVLALQGPSAFDALRSALGVDASGLAFGQLREVALEGRATVVCRTGYTGEQGVELIVPVPISAEVWDALLAQGVEPCGLAARDTLRLEMGYPLHGNELGPDTSPYEARSGWAVKLDGRSFVGRDALAAAKEAGPARRLWGLVGDSRRPPRAGMEVTVDGTPAGVVTSGSFSPVLGVGIGLALLDASVGEGATATVDVRGTDVAFAVVRPPMVDADPH